MARRSWPRGRTLAVPGVLCLAVRLATAQTAAAGVPAAQPDSSGAVTGRVIAQEDGRPIPFATVVILETGRARFADEAGRYAITRLAPARYHVRGRQIGFAPVDTAVDVLPGPVASSITFRLRRLTIRLPTVAVLGHGRRECLATGIPDSTADPELATVFAQLRENVDRFRLLLDEYPFRYRREERRVLHQTGGEDRVIQDDTVVYESRARARYQPGHVLYHDRDVHGQRRLYMYLPTFGDLADSAFQRLHCFDYIGEQRPENPAAALTVRIDFRPASTLRTPDVEGSLYLDASRFVIRRAVFRLTRSSEIKPAVLGVDVTTTFREIVPLVPVFDSTHATQPLVPIVSPDAPGLLVTRVVTEDDQYVGHEFEYGAPGDQSTAVASPAASPTPAPKQPPP